MKYFSEELNHACLNKTNKINARKGGISQLNHFTEEVNIDPLI